MLTGRDSFRQRAQVLEQRGQPDAAIQIYLKIGAAADAARVYANSGRYLTAAEVLLNSLGVPLEQVATLSSNKRQSAGVAAGLFQRGGDVDRAARVFLALGDFAAAATILEKANRTNEAAELFLRSGDPLSSARCYSKSNKFAEARDALLRLTDTDERYRLACVEASKLALALGDATPLMQRFVGTFLRSAPVNSEEKQALERFATLFGKGRRTNSATAVNGEARPISPDAEADIPGFSIGKVIADRYRLEAQLGRGSFSRVFRGIDLELKEKVVLKVLSPSDTDEKSISNFREELKLTRQLSHPNIIRIFDIGIHQGHRFFTMEFLIGSDLKSRLTASLDIGKALDYLVQACAGLEVAHARGIVHRDIKPDNFFVTHDDHLKIMDFGIARHDQGGFDAQGLVAGTPQYMAPEQIEQFEQVGPSADLYSLGVVAYEMLAGHVPFQAPELEQLLWMQKQAIPESMRISNPDVPEDLDRSVLKMLEKSPSRRFPSARAFASAIEPIRQRFAIDDFF